MREGSDVPGHRTPDIAHRTGLRAAGHRLRQRAVGLGGNRIEPRGSRVEPHGHAGVGAPAVAEGRPASVRPEGPKSAREEKRVWPIVSPPDAKWKAPYSARFHVGASAPGG